MNVQGTGCVLIAVLSLCSCVRGQESYVTAPAGTAVEVVIPESIPTPLPQTPAVGAPLAVAYAPPLAYLDRSYYVDKQRSASVARQYDKLMQAYPSAWAHYPYPYYAPPRYSASYPSPQSAIAAYPPDPRYGTMAPAPGYNKTSVYREPGSTSPTNTYRAPYGNPFPSSGSDTPRSSIEASTPSSVQSRPTEIPAPMPESIPTPPANRSNPVEF